MDDQSHQKFSLLKYTILQYWQKLKNILTLILIIKKRPFFA
ncbi:unnamed protein product [Paramecium octaurelia]|uniref:Uncharacterized protein n=1 Tax=Paramecium octaurelia TaxID=43137 RepID=A0A8S1V9L2_PAROT|nr:unnamed protein product [Paramecium octaurelia]